MHYLHQRGDRGEALASEKSTYVTEEVPNAEEIFLSVERVHPVKKLLIKKIGNSLLYY